MLEDGYGEVSYWVLPSARGRGVATRACVAATRWAHDLGLHRIQLQHSTHNEPSRRVALKAGFVEEGIGAAETSTTMDGTTWSSTPTWRPTTPDPQAGRTRSRNDHT